MAELLLAALAGIGLGVITGMPVGVINVSVVHAASHDQLRRAHGLGLGGALASGVHAALAGIGVAPRLLSSSWVPLFAVLGGGIIAAAAISMWRQGRRAASDASPSPASPEATAETTGAENANAAGAGHGRSDSLWRGFAAGMGMTLVNAAALTAWVAVATAWPMPTRKMAGAVAIGVAIGSALWFTLLARWVHRRRHHRWLRHTPRAAAVLLVGLAIFGILRGASLL